MQNQLFDWQSRLDTALTSRNFAEVAAIRNEMRMAYIEATGVNPWHSTPHEEKIPTPHEDE